MAWRVALPVASEAADVRRGSRPVGRFQSSAQLPPVCARESMRSSKLLSLLTTLGMSGEAFIDPLIDGIGVPANSMSETVAGQLRSGRISTSFDEPIQCGVRKPCSLADLGATFNVLGGHGDFMSCVDTSIEVRPSEVGRCREGQSRICPSLRGGSPEKSIAPEGGPSFGADPIRFAWPSHPQTTCTRRIEQNCGPMCMPRLAVCPWQWPCQTLSHRPFPLLLGMTANIRGSISSLGARGHPIPASNRQAPAVGHS